MSEQRQCPGCGRVVGAEDRFCSGCGSPVAPGAEGLRVSRPPLEEVFAHLRSGEQRPATILMADLSGYSALGEEAHPEWVFHLINDVFGELVECLVAHGAHIDKYLGDEIIALFGAPVAQERSTERAVRAALATRERLHELNAEGRFGDVKLGIHIGINVGPVMVGPVGHRDYSGYTVIGDAVNLAKRLEDAAPEGDIYVSHSVREAVSDLFDFDPIGPLSLAGRRQKAEVFRLLIARHETSSPSHLLGEVPFIGREAEMQALCRHTDLVGQEGAAYVYVAGPPGIGKSRLIAEWENSSETSGFHRVAFVSCYAFGEHFPFLPLVDAVTQLAGLRLEGWPPRVVGDIRQALEGLPVAANPAGSAASPAGLESSGRERLIELLQSTASPQPQASEDWREELCGALAELLAGLTRERPVYMVIEDIHWLDEPSRDILSEVFSRQDAATFLFIASSRSMDLHGDEGEAAHEAALEQPFIPGNTVRLAPLPRPAMERLVQAWAAPSVLPSETIAAICDRAQGHPYFARELVHGLRHSGKRGAEAVADASLPNTLQDLFLAQLDRLPRPLRHLVQAASVVGEPISFPLLKAAMTEELPLTESLLKEATSQGLLHVGSIAGQFTFARRLLFESAYTTIPPTQRQGLHARIADHLVEQLDSLGAAAIHATAHHAYLGYRDERALDFLLRSAYQYRIQYANRQAIRDAGRALEIIGSLPQPERWLDQRLEALLFLSQSYEVLGDLGHAEGTLAEAEVLLEDCSKPELSAQILTSAATLRLMQGQWVEAEKTFSESCKQWERLENQGRAAHALLGMGMCARQRGIRDRALELFQQAAERGTEALWVRAAALNNAGVLLLEEGRHPEAECLLVEALAANETEGDRRGLAHCKASLGELYFRLGRFEAARRWLEQSSTEAETIDDAECVGLAAGLLARALIAEGNLRKARQVLGGSSNLAERINDLQVKTVLQLAQFEARSSEGEEQSLLNDILAWHTEILGDTSSMLTEGPVRNVIAETAGLGLELALRLGEAEAVVTLTTQLRGLRPDLPDVRLRAYLDFLLDGAETPDSITPGPLNDLEPTDYWGRKMSRLPSQQRQPEGTGATRTKTQILP